MKNTHIIALIMLCLSAHMQAMDLASKLALDQHAAQDAEIFVNRVESTIDTQSKIASSAEHIQAISNARTAIASFRTAKKNLDDEREALKENSHDLSRYKASLRVFNQANADFCNAFLSIPF